MINHFGILDKLGREEGMRKKKKTKDEGRALLSVPRLEVVESRAEMIILEEEEEIKTRKCRRSEDRLV